MSTPCEIAFEKIERFGDKLVIEAIRSSDDFFAASDFHKKAYGVCSLFHHAGANGLRAVFDCNHCDGPCVFLAALGALKEMGAERFHNIAQDYWDRITESARNAGIFVPSEISNGKRSDFYAIYDFWMKKDSGFCETLQELSELGGEFVSCWESELPELAIKWIEKQTEPNQAVQTTAITPPPSTTRGAPLSDF